MSCSTSKIGISAEIVLISFAMRSRSATASPANGSPKKKNSRLRCQWKAHIEQALAAVGKRRRLRAFDAGEAKIANEFHGIGVNIGEGSRRVPHRVTHARACLNGKANVFFDAQSAKQIGDLERAADPCPGDIFGFEPCD